MTTIPQDIRDKLREPFPAEAISQHPTKTFLSTIKAIYIVERLNNIFGIGGWVMNHEIVSDLPDYVAVAGHIQIKEPYDFATPIQYGGHKKTGTNTEPADGYKSAVTDCQSKCASYLEIGIDVFKGLTDPPKSKKPPKQQSTGGQGSKQISQKQWDFMKKIATDKELTETELVEMVKWVAEKNKIEPRHWKIAKLMLPKENFETVFTEYCQFQSARDEKDGDDVPY